MKRIKSIIRTLVVIVLLLLILWLMALSNSFNQYISQQQTQIHSMQQHIQYLDTRVKLLETRNAIEHTIKSQQPETTPKVMNEQDVKDELYQTNGLKLQPSIWAYIMVSAATTYESMKRLVMN